MFRFDDEAYRRNTRFISQITVSIRADFHLIIPNRERPNYETLYNGDFVLPYLALTVWSTDETNRAAYILDEIFTQADKPDGKRDRIKTWIQWAGENAKRMEIEISKNRTIIDYLIITEGE